MLLFFFSVLSSKSPNPALKSVASAIAFFVFGLYRYTSACFAAVANANASHSADASQIVCEQSATKPRTNHSETPSFPCTINQNSYYISPLMSGMCQHTITCPSRHP